MGSIKLKTIAGLAASAVLTLAASNASAVCAVGDECLVDEFGANIILFFDDAAGTGWKGDNEIGTFVGFLESPPDFSESVEPIVCPLSGEYVVIDVTAGVKDTRAGLFSNCWCGEGGNPAKRAMKLTYDTVAQDVLFVESFSAAHAFRCDARTQVFDEFEIGSPPFTPTPTSTPFSTPEFATSTATF